MTEGREPLFNGKSLRRLILPLIIEQFLAVAIGMADTVMVARTGEDAMSGVALVDAINILLINIFAALATGGTIVASQYLGREDRKRANAAAKQLVFIVAVLAVVIMALCLAGNTHILNLIFGKTPPSIMENARIYFFWSALSYPFLALYNAGAALFRAAGNSGISMLTSALMNFINIAGNAWLIFGLHMGVAGAAIASLVSRVVGAVLVLYLLRFRARVIRLESIWRPDIQPAMIRNILKFGIPGGLENGMFQIGRLMTTSLVSGFGEVAIAANTAANSIAAFPQIPGAAIGMALVTVVGRCIGAGRPEEAKRYILRLMGLTYAAMGVLNLLLLLLLSPVVGIYNLTPDTTALATRILTYYAICSMTLWPMSFALPNGLRAAGDIRFTMIVSIVSMWVFRIGFSYLLAGYMRLGVFGVWIAMTIDWAVRIVCFVTRFFSGRWKEKNILKE